MSILQLIWLWTMLLALLLGAHEATAQVKQATATRTARQFAITLRPVRGATGEVTAVTVQQKINGVPPPAGQVFDFVAPVTLYGIIGIAGRIHDFTLTDMRGPVAFTTKDDATSHRRWLPARPVRFPLKVTYTVLVQAPLLAGSPPLGLRPGAQGLTAAGDGFLLLPENSGTTTIRLQWDLRKLPAGSVGISSFGEGEFVMASEPERLNESWLMAGPVQRYTAASSGLHAFGLGPLPFDAPAEMAWAQRT